MPSWWRILTICVNLDTFEYDTSDVIVFDKDFNLLTTHIRKIIKRPATIDTRELGSDIDDIICFFTSSMTSMYLSTDFTADCEINAVLTSNIRKSFNI